MKKLSILFVSLVLVLFNACTGDIGPAGFDGQDGADGLIGSIFEVEATFTEAEGFGIIY